MNNSKIIFTYLKTGGGHYAPVKAISDFLSKSYPNEFEIVLCDFFKDIGKKKLDDTFLRAWNSMLKYPKFNKYGHALLSLFIPLVQVWLYLNFNNAVQSCAVYIEKEKPTVVVSTHSFAAYVLGRAKRITSHNFKLITLSSDPLSSHVFIEQLRNQDLFIVSSAYSQMRLEKAGVAPANIRQMAFPVNRDFHPDLLPSKELLASLSLNPNHKTLLISFGGQGVGNIQIYLHKIIEHKIPLNVIVVCGNNAALKLQLEKKFPENKNAIVKVIPKGFVTNMNELIALSDICFIKPGVSTSFEVMLMKKPIIFYESAAHIEDANVEYAVKNGIGLNAGKDVNKFIEALRFLLFHDGLEKISDLYQSLSLENGTEDIGNYLVTLLEE